MKRFGLLLCAAVMLSAFAGCGPSRHARVMTPDQADRYEKLRDVRAFGNLDARGKAYVDAEMDYLQHEYEPIPLPDVNLGSVLRFGRSRSAGAPVEPIPPPNPPKQ